MLRSSPQYKSLDPAFTIYRDLGLAFINNLNFFLKGAGGGEGGREEGGLQPTYKYRGLNPTFSRNRLRPHL